MTAVSQAAMGDDGELPVREAAAADDGQAVVGQHRLKLSRHHDVTAAQQGNGRTRRRRLGKDVGDDKQPTRGEHSADLGQPC
jgi:hypothetical protein